MGDYIVNETLTGNYGNWPNFTRSTGVNIFFPLETSGQGELFIHQVYLSRLGLWTRYN